MDNTKKIGDLDFLDFEIIRGQVVPKIVTTAKDTPEGVGFVDQLSFTFNDDFHTNKPLARLVASWGGGYGSSIQCDAVITVQVAAMLRHVFGLGVGAKRPAGLNFYRDTWQLLDGCGMVSIGGQGGTILVQITGHGMACSRDGWQGRLREFAAACTRFVLTRVDVAYDDHQGAAYGVDKAVQDYQAGEFQMGGRPPSCEQRGNWLRFDGRGRSFYVGRRENGKMLRVYEKGRQLGDESSEWVRVELELHNKDRVIPLDILERPGAFLAGAYSALAWVCDASASEKIATIAKIARMTYDTMLGHLGRSYGGFLKVVLQVEAEALDRLEQLGRHRPTPRRLDLALMPLAPA